MAHNDWCWSPYHDADRHEDYSELRMENKIMFVLLVLLCNKYIIR